MIDSHAHLYFDRFDADRDPVIRRARDAGVKGIINIGVDRESSQKAIELSELHPGLFAAAGIHPTTPVGDLEAAVEEIHRLAREHPQQVVAIGEIGLDFYWKEVPAAAQAPKLALQLELARELSLPVIIHCREALPELLELLEKEPELPPGVFHCFSGSAGEAGRALALGFHVSFCGNLTYPKAEELRRSAAAVPPERLLLETDAPFLPPQPVRGQKRNEPAFLPHTRDALARIHGLAPEALDRLTEETTRRLFKLEAGDERSSIP